MRSDFKWLVWSTDSGSRPFFAYKTILTLSSDSTGIPSVGYLLFLLPTPRDVKEEVQSIIFNVSFISISNLNWDLLNLSYKNADK